MNRSGFLRNWFGGSASRTSRQTVRRRYRPELETLEARVVPQATRTWVSGVGDDANPGSRTAPCKTFAGAIAKTAVGGEIDVLDPGGFGAVTITKSIHIEAIGMLGGVLVSGTNGIVINAPGANVVLKGLTIEGLGTGLDGIDILSAGSVSVEDCTIRDFIDYGIEYTSSATGKLFVSNTIMGNSTKGGILMQPAAGGVDAALNGITLQGNGLGLEADTHSLVTLSNSLIASNTGDGVLSSSSTITLDNNVFAFNGTDTATKGTGTIHQSGGSNGGGTVATPAAIAGVGTTSLNTVVGTTFGTLLQALVTDSSGNPIANVPVTFTAPASGPSGTFDALATVPTNALGIATAPAFTANHTPGSFTVSASATGLNSAASFSLTNTTDPAAIKVSAGSAQHATVNNGYTTAVAARVTNAANKPVVGITVDFEVPGSGPGGTFLGNAAVTTDVNGVATAPTLSANTVAGSFTVMAWVPGVNTPAVFSLSNKPGAAALATATAGTPQNGASGKAYKTALKATITDSFGNPLSGVSVTFTAPSNTPSGTFPGNKATATAVTDANGVATAPTFTAGTTLGAFVVTAAASGTTSASFNLTNVVGPAAKLLTVGAKSSRRVVAETTTINGLFAAPLVVEVTDAFGHPVSGAQVTFKVYRNSTNGAGAAFNGKTAVTVTSGPDGQASAPLLKANNRSGSFIVIASVVGVANKEVFRLAIQ